MAVPGVTNLTSVVNLAFARLGLPAVDSLEDSNDQQAVIAKAIVPTVIANVQSSYPWPECIHVATLTTTGNTSSVDDAVEYTLPGDLLTLLEISLYSDWRIEAGKLYVPYGDTSITVKYIRYVENPTHWSSYLFGLILPTLAFELGAALGADARYLDLQRQEAEFVRRRLMRLSAWGGQAPKTQSVSSTFTQVRTAKGFIG